MKGRLSEILLEKRKLLNKKQEDVAAAIGKGLRTYQYYEDGSVTPRDNTLVKLSKELKFDLKEIYEDATKLHIEGSNPVIEELVKSNRILSESNKILADANLILAKDQNELIQMAKQALNVSFGKLSKSASEHSDLVKGAVDPFEDVSLNKKTSGKKSHH